VFFHGHPRLHVAVAGQRHARGCVLHEWEQGSHRLWFQGRCMWIRKWSMSESNGSVGKCSPGKYRPAAAWGCVAYEPRALHMVWALITVADLPPLCVLWPRHQLKLRALRHLCACPCHILIVLAGQAQARGFRTSWTTLRPSPLPPQPPCPYFCFCQALARRWGPAHGAGARCCSTRGPTDATRSAAPWQVRMGHPCLCTWRCGGRKADL